MYKVEIRQEIIIKKKIIFDQRKFGVTKFIKAIKINQKEMEK